MRDGFFKIHLQRTDKLSWDGVLDTSAVKDPLDINVCPESRIIVLKEYLYKGINKGAGDLKCRDQVRHVLFISNNESQSHGYNYYWRIIAVERGDQPLSSNTKKSYNGILS